MDALYLERLTLTMDISHVRMQTALVIWARSSMVEQRPFKPFVESSILSALTKKTLVYEGLFC